MKKGRMKSSLMLTLMLILVLAVCGTVSAESYTATTMRLLHYEGTVEIESEDGGAGFLMENIRLNSGEALRTGADGMASIGLDPGRIVTMEYDSRVEFFKEGDAMKLTLTEGALLLDVQDKLDENETLDIQTANMTVGIRGTIVYVSVRPEERRAELGVLEGTAQLTYLDSERVTRTLPVPAGNKAVVEAVADTGDGVGAMQNEQASAQSIQNAVIEELKKDEIPAFVEKRLKSDPALKDRVENALPQVITDSGDSYSKESAWSWDETVTLVAQSASKLYDGQPLTRTGDVLVYGLPSDFSIQVAAGGSLTDAGECANPISRYTIYNMAGEDVTSHFSSINTVDGQLIVDPAPMTIWTGSAEKLYDGTPLTNPEAGFSTVKGYVADQPVWRNISYVSTKVVTTDIKTDEILYGLCGVTWVHGTNPLTGEVREIQLKAGEKLSVFLHTENDKESIEFKIEPVSEKELPQEILRLYADNPELLEQACADAKWDPELVKKLISELPDETGASVEQNSLQVKADQKNRLMKDSTNVRITIDTEITNYDGRALGSEEAHYTPINIDDSIKIIPTGSQTDAGESPNTCTIDWGNANKNNYVVSEEIGKLTVLPAPASVTTGSASKVYDGTPLTSEEAAIEGLVNNETAVVTATGTITEVGTAANTCTIEWGSANPGNYSVTEQLGTLEVTAADGPVTFTADSVSKVYDGTPLTGSYTITGLPEGFTGTAEVSGSQTDVGSSENTVTGYRILDETGADVTSSFADISVVNGTLTVTPAEAVITTGSASKEYDGTPLTSPEASISGLAGDETAAVTATGAITDVGTAENSYTIDWGSTNPDNYTVAEELGTLEITPNTAAVTFSADSGTKTYDGTPLTGSYTVTGVPDGFFGIAEVSGSQTDAGSSENTITEYKILNSKEEDVTGSFADISTENGTLTVTPAEAVITTGSASKEFDGMPLTSPEASVSGLVGDETAAVAATGTITDVGTAENGYTIDWGSTNPDNYTVAEELGTLEITPNMAAIIFSAVSDSREYDGTPLYGDYTVTGLPDGFFGIAEVSGIQTDAGSSGNTVTKYKILNSKEEDVTDSFANISTEDGTLTVTPAEATVTTGSASKEYDGTPLTEPSGSISGLADGDTATVTGTGTQTGVGTSKNNYEIDWGETNPDNYTINEEPGTLEVTPNTDKITFRAYGVEGWYTGKPVSDAMVEAEGLPSGFTYTAETSGSRTYPGSSPVTVSSYKIFDPDGDDVTENFTNIETVDGEISIMQASLWITTESASKEYDGTALTESSGTISGLVNGETAFLKTTGSQTEIGTSDNTYEIEWGTADPENYSVGSVNLGKLEVTQISATVTFKAVTDSREYDGTPLYGDFEVEGLPDGYFGIADVSGSQTNVGSTVYSIEEYRILDMEEEDATDLFANISTEDGTLTVTPKEVIVTTGSASKTYDGTPLKNAEASITGLADGETASVTATGSITDAGTSWNSYSIDWGTTDPDNYTVNGSQGLLTVNQLGITLDVNCYTVDEDRTTHRPYRTEGTYDDNGESLEAAPDGYSHWSATHTIIFSLRGGGELQVFVGDGYSEPGTYTVIPELTYMGANPDNYKISLYNNVMIINGMGLEPLGMSRGARFRTADETEAASAGTPGTEEEKTEEEKTETGKAGEEESGAEKGGEEETGTEKGEAEESGTEKAGAEKGGAEGPGTEKAGAEKGEAEGLGTGQTGAEKGGAEGPWTEQNAAAEAETGKAEIGPQGTLEAENTKAETSEYENAGTESGETV